MLLLLFAVSDQEMALHVYGRSKRRRGEAQNRNNKNTFTRAWLPLDGGF
jgi:hypothetical protein